MPIIVVAPAAGASVLPESAHVPAATAHGDELFFKGWPGLPVEVVAPADAVAAFRNEALSKAPPVLNSANVPICGTRRSPNAPQQIRVPFVSSPQVSLAPLLIDLKVLPSGGDAWRWSFWPQQTTAPSWPRAQVWWRPLLMAVNGGTGSGRGGGQLIGRRCRIGRWVVVSPTDHSLVESLPAGVSPAAADYHEALIGGWRGGTSGPPADR